MAGWQDEVARKARDKANAARGKPEYEALDREASAREAEVNAALRRENQRTKY